MSFVQKSISARGFGSELKFWTEWHALIVVLALLGVVSGMPVLWFPIAAALSFSVLILRFKTRWTPTRKFGPANAITLFRLIGALLLLFQTVEEPFWIGGFALILFALDGVDGWVARRWHLSSEFGEYFDKEVDAFFLLVLCFLIYSQGRLGVWVLLPGLLRYFFVAYLKWLDPHTIKEKRSRFGCWSFFLVMLALISAFLVPESVYFPLILLMTCVLCASFANTIWNLVRQPGKTV